MAIIRNSGSGLGGTVKATFLIQPGDGLLEVDRISYAKIRHVEIITTNITLSQGQVEIHREKIPQHIIVSTSNIENISVALPPLVSAPFN